MSQAALEILEYNRQFNKIIEALALEGVIDIEVNVGFWRRGQLPTT